MNVIPFSQHVFDWSAYRIVATFEECPRDAFDLDLFPLYWRGYLRRSGGQAWRITDHGLDFCAAFRWWAAEQVIERPGCCACGGVYHPSTGHLLSPSMRLCGPCAKDHAKWLRGMLNRKWGKADFYRHAATSVKGN